MQGQEWMYYLLDTDGRSYYIENGVLHVSSTPRPIRYSPDGWKDISLGWERNLDDWGNVINYSLPNTFVLDGADILRYLLDTFNFEKVVNMLIQRQSLFIDNTNYYWYYKFFYKGEIDLSSYEDDELGITVNIMQGQVSKKIKAFQTTQFQIEPDDLIVKMDGATLVGSKKFAVLDVSYNHGNSGAFTVKEMIPMFEATGEGNFFNIFFAPSVASPSDANFSYIQDENLSESTKYNGLATSDVVIKRITISGKIGLKPTVTGGRVGLDFIMEKVLGPTSSPTYTSIALFTLNHTFTPGNTTPVDFELTTGPITINAGETFFIYTRPNANQNTNQWTFGETTTWEYVTLDKVPTSYVKAKRPYNLFKDLVEKATGMTDVVVSELLQSKPNLVVTCGDALRRLDNPKIRTTISNFKTAFNAVLNTATGVIGNKYYLEKKEFFLKDENVIPLGQVKEFKRSLPTDIMGNVLKLGYDPKDSDDVNGKLSFNNTNIYTSPVTRIAKDISIVSPYITDPYVIEIYRANLEGKKTTDDSKDTSVYILNIDYDNPQTLAEDAGGYPAGTVYYNLKRVVYDVITGVEEGDTLFNIEDLTPNRLFDVHANYLNAIFWGFAGQKLTFQDASKNQQLYTSIGGVVHDEDSDYTINTNPILFKPTVFEFKPEPNSELAETLLDNPNRCFSFIHPNGRTYRGFNLKIGIAPNTEQEQAFELLAVADQDLTTLKYYS